MTTVQAATLGVGDRELPLEADLEADIVRKGDLIGKTVEVSPIAGGELKDLHGKAVKIVGTIERFGQTVGYQVELEGETHLGTGKDFYLDRDLIEDLQPPSATSASIKEALSHWSRPHTYWGSRTDGLEALCFQLATVTPRAAVVCFPWGWRFLVPDPRPGCLTLVDCRAFQHGSYWTLAVSVVPQENQESLQVPLIEDHWARTFIWMAQVIRGMLAEAAFPWAEAYQEALVRSKKTLRTLRPLFFKALEQCVSANGGAPVFPPGSVSVAISEVRLKAGSVGLVEPPSDRRPYTVVSISPAAFSKDADYLEQVLLHECLHLVVASTGGEPHNGTFNELADRVGLRREHRE